MTDHKFQLYRKYILLRRENNIVNIKNTRLRLLHTLVPTPETEESVYIAHTPLDLKIKLRDTNNLRRD